MASSSSSSSSPSPSSISFALTASKTGGGAAGIKRPHSSSSHQSSHHSSSHHQRHNSAFQDLDDEERRDIEQKAITSLVAGELTRPVEKVHKVIPMPEGGLKWYERRAVDLGVGDDLKVFKSDIDKRPESASMEQYESMSVDDFGKAMLLGMKWKEGEAIGGKNKGLVNPIQYVPRPDKLGLGAQPKDIADMPPPSRRIPKPGEQPARSADLVARPGEDGKVRHVVDIGEKLVDRKELEKETQMKKEQEAKAAAAAAATTAKKPSSSSSSSNSSSSKKSKTSNEKSWFEPHLRIRIIREDKFYNKKGVIRDVVMVDGSARAIVKVDGGAVVEGLKLHYAETIVPQPGGTVRILRGSHKGQSGKILSKDKVKEKARVHLTDDGQSIDISYDDLCEVVLDD